MMSNMAAPSAESARQRLATLVTQRRVRLGMNKIDVARAAGITITTYNKIEDGISVRDTSYGKIEKVLQWAPGACLDILNGAAGPTLVDDADVKGAFISPVAAGDLTDDVASAVQDAAIAVSDDLTAAQIRELKERVVAELRKRGRIPDIDGN